MGGKMKLASSNMVSSKSFTKNGENLDQTMTSNQEVGAGKDRRHIG
jgi:hypothetical protein